MVREFIAHISGDTKGLEKAVAQSKGMLQKLSDNQVLIELQYDGNIKQFNKIFQDLIKQHPELTIQLQYDVNKKILDDKMKELSAMEALKLDVDAGNVNKRIEGMVSDIKKAFDEGIESEDELFVRVRELYKYVNTAKALNISVSEGSLNQVVEMSEHFDKIADFVTSNRAKKIQLFKLDGSLDKTISKTRTEVEDIGEALTSLQEQGASPSRGGGISKQLDDELTIIKEDIRELQERMDNLSGEKFEEVADQVANLRDRLTEVLVLMGGKANNALLKDIEEFLTGGTAGGNKKIQYWEDVVANFDKLDEKTKSVLRTLGLISDSGGLKAITDGANNYGGLIGDENTVIVRKKENTTIDNVRRLKAALDEAADAGVQCSRIVGFIETANGDIIELQKTIKGDMLATSGDETTGYFDIFSPKALKASAEQIQKFYHDIKKLMDLGLEPDIVNPSNIIYDEEKGFQFLDISFKEKDITFEKVWGEFLDNMQGNIEDYQAAGQTEIADMMRGFAEKLGQCTVEGFRQGIDAHSNSKEAERAVDDFANGVVDEFEKRTDDMAQAARKAGDAVSESFSERLKDGMDELDEVLPNKDSTSGESGNEDSSKYTYTEDDVDRIYDRHANDMLAAQHDIDDLQEELDDAEADKRELQRENAELRRQLSKSSNQAPISSATESERQLETAVDDVTESLREQEQQAEETAEAIKEVSQVTDDVTPESDTYLPAVVKTDEAIVESQGKAQEAIGETNTLLRDLGELLSNLTGNNLRAFDEAHGGILGISDDNLDEKLEKLKDIKQIITKLTRKDPSMGDDKLLQMGIDARSYESISRKIPLLEKLGYTVSEIREGGAGYEADIIPISDKAITNAEDMLGILFDIKKQSQDLAPSTEPSTDGLEQEERKLDDVKESAEKAAEAKEGFADANATVLQSIIESIKGLGDESSAFKSLNDLLKMLGNSKDDKIQRIADNIQKIRDAFNGSVDDNSFINALKEIASQGENLKDLAEALKASKKQIENAKKANQPKDNSGYFDVIKKQIADINFVTNKGGFTDEIETRLKNIRAEFKAIQNKSIISDDDVKKIGEITERYKALKKEMTLSTNKTANAKKIQSLLGDVNDILTSNTTRKFRTSTLFKELQQFQKQLQSFDASRPKNELDELSERLLKTIADVKGLDNSFKGKGFMDRFANRLTDMNTKFLAQYFSWHDMLRYARTMLSTIIDLDTQLVDLRKTTTMNNSELERFYKNSSNVAKELGVTTSEIIQQASAWSRLGYSSNEAATEMAKLSSQFASISPGMDVTQATDGLVSTMKAFGYETDEVLDGIMSKINIIGNTAATSNQEIVDMLTRSSASMAEANNTLEETIALETAAVEITRSAETTGTMYKTKLCLCV